MLLCNIAASIDQVLAVLRQFDVGIVVIIPCHFRQSNQSWGLRLVGGHDVGTLLKVEKVNLLQKYLSQLFWEVA